MKCVTKRVALIAEAASAAITLAVSLDAADYAYQQCTLIVYVWAVVKWTGACQGYDRSHCHQTLVVDDDNSTPKRTLCMTWHARKHSNTFSLFMCIYATGTYPFSVRGKVTSLKTTAHVKPCENDERKTTMGRAMLIAVERDPIRRT